MPKTNCARNLASHYLDAERGKIQSLFRRCETKVIARLANTGRRISTSLVRNCRRQGVRLESLRVLIPEVCNNKMFSIKQHPRVKKVGPVQALGPDACMLYAATYVIGRCSEVSDEGQD